MALIHFCSLFTWNREINTHEIQLPNFCEIKYAVKISKNKVFVFVVAGVCHGKLYEDPRLPERV